MEAVRQSDRPDVRRIAAVAAGLFVVILALLVLLTGDDAAPAVSPAPAVVQPALPGGGSSVDPGTTPGGGSRGFAPRGRHRFGPGDGDPRDLVPGGGADPRDLAPGDGGSSSTDPDLTPA